MYRLTIISCFLLCFSFIANAYIGDEASNSTTTIKYFERDGRGNPVAVDLYENERITSKENLYWAHHPFTNEVILKSKVWEDGNGTPLASRVFDYDDNGLLIGATFYGNLSGTQKTPLSVDKEGYPDAPCESYTTRWTYSQEDGLTLIFQSEDNGKTILYIYDRIIKKLTAELTGDGLNILHRRFFDYNSDGLLSSLTIDDGSSIDVSDIRHVHERHVIDYTYVNNSDVIDSITEKYFQPSTGQLNTTLRIVNIYSLTSPREIIGQDFYDRENRLIRTDQFYNEASIDAIIPQEDSAYATNYTARGEPTVHTLGDGTIIKYKYFLDGTLKEETDNQGNITIYQRDLFGRAIKIDTYDATGTLNASIYNNYDAFHLKEYFDAINNVHYQYHYNDIGQLISVQDISKPIPTNEVPPEPVPSPSAWTSLWNAASRGGKKALNTIKSVKDYLNEFKSQVAYSEYIKDDLDYALHQVFSESYLQFAGHYKDTSHIGIYNPNHEINDKVRITLINGILTIKEDLTESLKQFSDVHGGNTIHYVFRSTEGWTNDLFDSAYIKSGYTSNEAKLLADLWRKLIQEMGGPHNGGTILHYAHSIGATDTCAAKNLLTPEEGRIIHVVTLGSPTLIPNSAGFANVINYASKSDPICMVDMRGYINGWLASDSNVRFVGNFWEYPLIEHTLGSKSYSDIIAILGEQFVTTYRTSSTN